MASIPQPTGEPSPALPRVSFGAWWMLAVLFFLYVLSFTDRYMLTMLVEPIQADLGISDFNMGIILGPAFGLVMGVFGIPLGWAADRYPRRWVVFLGAAAWSLATAACGVAQTTAALALARVGVGVGEATLSPAATSLLADKFPRHRLTLAVAIYQSGVKVGSAVAFALGGLLIGLTAGMRFQVPFLGVLEPWQIAFILIGAPGVLFSLLVFTFSEPARTGRRSSAPVRMGDLVTYFAANWRVLTPMLLGCALMALCAYSLTAWTPTFLDRRFGWEPAHYGPALGLISLLAAGTLVIKGSIVDWLYGRGMKDAHIRFYSWMLAAGAPLAIWAFFIPNPWVFLVVYGVVQVIAVPSMVYLSATLALLAPNELRAQLTAVAYAIYTILGLGVGPTVVGALTDFVFHDPVKLGWSLAVVLGVCVPAAFLLLRLNLLTLRPALEEAERAS